MTEQTEIIIEVYGEGKTDIGDLEQSRSGETPVAGVLPVLIEKICNQHKTIHFIREKIAQLQKKKGSDNKELDRKVKFAKERAFYRGSHGLVFVLDTEGDHPRKKLEVLKKGRALSQLELPTAVGVAHPCIESWLLCDAAAMQRGLELSFSPSLPTEPEKLPAPNKDRSRNPKTVLRECVQRPKISARDATSIALRVNIETVETVCCQSFQPFAVEVRTHILPLFPP